MGKSNVTRAGYKGAITTTELKEVGTGKTNGFGVFAYFTGSDTYNTYNYNNASTLHVANFMYNQQVKWQTGTEYEGYVNGEGTGGSAGAWTYTPIKYWPNEVQNGSVDDQNNDAANDPATGSSTYGGNVSFFAYAPYVALPQVAAS